MEEIMNIRIASLNDIERINELFWQSDLFHHNNEPNIYEKTNEGHRSKEYIETILNEDKDIFVVLELDDKIIGFLYGYEEIKGKLPFHKKRKYFVLDNIVIDTKYQNKGYGKKLIDYIIEYSNKKMYDDIMLNVYTFNKKAISIYEKYGFRNLSQNMSLKLR
jgi:ribosomal protein S18 acetylase RimI-like enzyme